LQKLVPIYTWFYKQRKSNWIDTQFTYSP
jgi:hypothetical protein